MPERERKMNNGKGLSLIGGDPSPYDCPNCASPNTTYEEYATNDPEESELGIICDDCEHRVEPYNGYDLEETDI